MNLTHDQIFHKMSTQNYCVLVIWAGKVEDTGSKSPFETIEVSETGQLKNKFTEFAKVYTGQMFTGMLKLKKTTRDEVHSTVQFFFSTSEQVQIVTATDAPINGMIDRDEMKREILAEIQGEQKQKSLADELADTKAELLKKTDNTDRMFQSITNLAMGIFLPPEQFQQYTASMNGLEGQQATNNNNTMDNKPIEVKDPQRIEKACVILIQQIGEENLIKLAAKVENGIEPAMKSVLIGFINS